MSQNDWNFTLADANTFVGGTSGSAVQHSILTNPLTSSGDWCRGFFSVTQYYAATVSMVPISNSEITNSSGYEYGYGYSIRLWSRVHDSNTNFTKITFKGNNILSINVNGGFPSNTTGYSLVHYRGNLQLYCRANESVYNSDGAVNDPLYYNNGFFKDNILALPHSTWHLLRMDVSPISGAYDKITIFTGSSGIWSQIYTENIPRLKTGAYVPWANNPNGDSAAATGKGYLGVTVRNDQSNYPVYIDQFEVYKERIIA